MKWFCLLLFPSLIAGQCGEQLPSGKECGPDDFFTEPDPENCSMYYDCIDGCVEHKKCLPLDDGLPRLYDQVYEWCTYKEDMECGERPCGEVLPSGKNCGPDDFFDEADPNNCSMFYECVDTCVEHEQCQPLADGYPRVFDDRYEWCSYKEDVDCGSRPCGEYMPSGYDCVQGDNFTEADPNNCSMFYECVDTCVEHKQCLPLDDGLPRLYDQKYERCSYKDDVDCGGRLCSENLPSGYDCGLEDHFTEGDPNDCSMYFDCSEGCVEHKKCEPLSDGLARLYDQKYEMCSFKEDVDCGERPNGF